MWQRRCLIAPPPSLVSFWRPRWRSAVPSIPLCDLDLLRAGGLDPRPAALFHPSTHPHAAVFEPFRLEAHGGEIALIAFQDGDRERLRPSPPEIHIDCAPALADRQHL